MNQHSNRARAALVGLAGIAAVTLLASCSTAPEEPTVDPDAPVTITLGELPPTENAEVRQALLDRIEDFEELHPNITIEPEETRWAADTYQAMLAGGTMPTTLRVPLTEIQGLAERGQVSVLTPYVEDDDVLSSLNPALVDGATRDGEIYGIPVGGYTMGFVYNRAVYEAAGLDPDTPPATWDEVRANAAAITEATGKPGFIIPTTNNAGGWITTAMSYGFGGVLEEDEGDSTVATIDNQGTQEALQFLHDVRWEDDAFGANFLLNADDTLREVSAGNAGQAVLAGDRYQQMVFNFEQDPQTVGIGPLPQDSDGLGTLAGGNIAVVNPEATPEQILAALEWTKFYYLDKFTSEDAAIADAEARAESGLPNGVPVIPLFDQEGYDQYLDYIADYIDVPRENFTAYLDSIGTLPLVPEPRVQAQQIYALLDSAVQAVLTDENADIAGILETANQQAQSLIDAG